MSFAADYPDNYATLSAEDRDNRAIIASDQCIIDGREFYIRGVIELPILDSEAEPVFLWGVWASLCPEDYDALTESWDTRGRENTVGPFQGRLGNRISVYVPTTADLKLTLLVQPVGERPKFMIDDVDHPLARSQRDGLTLQQARELAAAVLHDRSPARTN